MAPTVPPQVAMKRRTQEKPMPPKTPQAEVNQAKPTLTLKDPVAVEQEPEQAPEISLKDQAAAEEAEAAKLKAVADAQQEPIVTNPDDPGFVSLSEIASQGYDALHEAYRRQNAIKPKEYVPPEMTDRQKARLEEEMEAGRKSVARYAAQQANRPAPERDPREGTSTPVFRPADHVPGLNSRDPAGR